jgi:hypothetical protein
MTASEVPYGVAPHYAWNFAAASPERARNTMKRQIANFTSFHIQIPLAKPRTRRQEPTGVAPGLAFPADQGGVLGRQQLLGIVPNRTKRRCTPAARGGEVWYSSCRLANNVAMTGSTLGVVVCEACRVRTAEIVADDGRTLCSECLLGETGRPAPRSEGPNPDE